MPLMDPVDRALAIGVTRVRHQLVARSHAHAAANAGEDADLPEGVLRRTRADEVEFELLAESSLEQDGVRVIRDFAPVADLRGEAQLAHHRALPDVGLGG